METESLSNKKCINNLNLKMMYEDLQLIDIDNQAKEMQ